MAPVAVARRGLVAWLALLLRGMAMGVAELVPGVSGGTIAFVTGIYHEFVSALATFGPRSVVCLFTQGPVAFWHQHRLDFLGVLAIGMMLSILALARLLHTLLVLVPTLVWGFFFGLILASVVQIGRRRRRADLVRFGSIGLVAGLLLQWLDPVALDAGTWVFFAGGFIAVSAWLLPAISGSFMLLILGLYEPVLQAVNDLDLVVLTAFGAGCAVGILAMARLLHWLMARHGETLLSLLTGFMAGSLVALWPWRLGGQLLLPETYAAAAGAPAHVAGVLVTIFAGMVALWLLARLE